MSKRFIPLFPLQLVVFPRTRVPLHIFEERYKEMVGIAIRDNSEFGIVLAKEEGIVNAGCTVLVDKVLEMYPDGRMDIMTRGERRFEIVRLSEEKDYLQAEVEYFDDDDLAPVPDELRLKAVSNFRVLKGLDAAHGHGEPNLEDLQLSFQLAQAIPDPDFLNLLLRERSEAARLEHFNQYLADYLPRQKSIERMRVLAPTNGHGPKPAGFNG
ncbi:MAG: peptidase lon domain protein [Candidatus Solibacter sp.]|jgi:Lon protease-like protein|nr:peptidase lon domain protein [Candidatus Solibacter sp.]